MDKGSFAILIIVGVALAIVIWAVLRKFSNSLRAALTFVAVGGVAVGLYFLTSWQIEATGLVVGASYAAAVRLFGVSVSLTALNNPDNWEMGGANG